METRAAAASIETREAYAADIREMREKISAYLSGDISDEEFKKFRLHRGIYGQRADQKGFNMVRVKVPYGLLTSAQFAELACIARDYSDGIAHVTTRQDIQLHWVKLETVPDVMERLNAVGLTTREACGNSVRNVVGSPAAGVSRNELFDVTPYSHLLAKHLLRNSLSQTLPRKFKISFSGSSDESDGIIPWIHDIGFVAEIREVEGEPRRGFRVLVGGGLGGQPRVADILEEFMPAELIVPTAEAIIAIFNETGNRENRNKARMKYVLWKLGADEFRRRVFEGRQKIVESGRRFPEPETDPEDYYTPVDSTVPSEATGDADFDRWRSSNVFPQKQEGYNIVYITTTIGDLTVDQLLAISRIVDEYSRGEARTTAQQDIVLRWIRSSEITPVYRELNAAGLDQAGPLEISNVTSCPGADTCNLGITHSRALGRELTQMLQRQPDWSELLGGLRIKISGCPNSCGQHHVAAIGFHGATKKVDGGEIPSYIISIGGGLNSGKHTFGATLGRVPARHAAEAASRLLKRYLSQKLGEENFREFAERVGIRSFREDIKDLSDLAPAKLTKELFVDIGQETAFTAVTGEGECAA